MSDTSGKVSAEVLTEASNWFIDFNEGDVDAAAKVRFTQWLRKSPEHVSAYVQIAAAWEDAPLLQQEARFDREALYALAATEGNVTPLHAAARPVSETARPLTPVTRRFTTSRWQAIAACLVLALGMGVWFQWQRPPVYQTHIGEQRSIVLKDGSTLSLNARSRVRVAFSRGERRVDLLDGQAFFDVAKDPTRPFMVHSGTTVIRAVGTQFDVNRTRDGTVVTVIEGRIAVSDTAAPAGAGGGLQPRVAAVTPSVRLIDAGERITVARSQASVQKLADPSVATAWTQRKLVFDGAPLREVVEEFNRYNQQQIILTSEELARVRISASFSSVDSRRLVQFLEERFNASVEASATNLRISTDGDVIR